MDDSEKDGGLAAWWTPQVPSTPDVELPTTPARGIVSILSENRKEGRWLVPKHLDELKAEPHPAKFHSYGFSRPG